MKKYTPYVFPLVVLSVVFLLVFRWYSMRTQRLEKDSFAEGIEIENLSEDELTKSIKGVGDYDSVKLTSDSKEYQGIVRYEIKDNKVRFSVVADLPESDSDYKVWLKKVDGDATKELFPLVKGKGGYIGSAAISSELLPFEVLVSQDNGSVSTAQPSILKGVIKAK